MHYPVIGIVAEYNPFHGGHAYHIRRALEMTSAEAIVAVLSSDFVQRGGPALLDKHARAKMALACGVDLVLELPAIFSSQNAGVFAKAAADTLAASGVVTHIAFGAENPNQLTDNIVRILLNEPSSFKSILKNHLTNGLSFVEARARALDTLCTGGAQILAQSNNSLALEYLMRIKEKNYKMTPVAIARVGASYNSKDITDFSSASAIRSAIERKDWNVALSQMPQPAREILTNEANEGRIFADTKIYWKMLRSVLLRESAEQIALYAQMTEGIENKLKCEALRADSFEEWADACTSKRYPAGRIRRAAAHIILSLKHWESRAAQRLGPAYIKPLAMNKTGRALLREMKYKATLPVATKYGQAAQISKYAALIADFELTACEMRENFIPNGRSGSEHKRKIIIAEE